MRYYQFFFFPLVAITHIFGRKKTTARDLEEQSNNTINKMLTQINEIEVKLGELIPWPWESSIVIICQKREVLI